MQETTFIGNPGKRRWVLTISIVKVKVKVNLSVCITWRDMGKWKYWTTYFWPH